MNKYGKSDAERASIRLMADTVSLEDILGIKFPMEACHCGSPATIAHTKPGGYHRLYCSEHEGECENAFG